jgi:hypothetical protein
MLCCALLCCAVVLGWAGLYYVVFCGVLLCCVVLKYSFTHVISALLSSPRAASFAPETAAVDLPLDQLDPIKFPPHDQCMLLTSDWSPMLACAEEESEEGRRQEEEAGGEGAREFILRDFSLLKNQTLAFKVGRERGREGGRVCVCVCC